MEKFNLTNDDTVVVEDVYLELKQGKQLLFILVNDIHMLALEQKRVKVTLNEDITIVFPTREERIALDLYESIKSIVAYTNSIR